MSDHEFISTLQGLRACRACTFTQERMDVLDKPTYAGAPRAILARVWTPRQKRGCPLDGRPEQASP